MGSGFGVSTASGASNTINNSGVIAGTAFGVSAATGGVNTFSNFGTISGPTFSISAAAGGANILTSYAGSRLIGPVSFAAGGFNAFNFVGGNYLYTFSSTAPVTLFNAAGAPFVVNNTTGQVAVLDPTAISLTDRTLMQFSGGISSMIQGRLNGPTLSGATMQAVSFAPVPTSPISRQASDVFAEIPSLTAYAPGGRMVTKAPPIAPVVGTTTVWASGFGGVRDQNAVGPLLDGRSTAYGGLIGVDRVIRPDLLVGGFLGGGSSRQTTGFGQQADNTDYIFGGAYGRFDWRTQFLDFALYGGSTSTSTNRTVSNNLAPNGLETATGKFNGWFISPELTYGYRFMLPDGFMLTPTAKVRYLAAFLDGFTEAGSAQNMSVKGRTIEDAEERLLLDVSKVFSNSSGQALKLSVQGGFIALQRVGGTNVNITLLGPSLSFATPGKDHTVGELVAGGFDLRVTNRVSVFGTGEFTWMDDKSSTATGKGGLRVSF